MKRLSILFLIVNFNIYSQQNESIKITPEIYKIFLSKKVNKDWNPNIYETIDVDSLSYYEFEKGEIVSEVYIKQLEIVEKYKKYYDEYENTFNYNTNKINDLDTIISKIKKYINSNTAYKIKKQLLIDSHEIAKKYNLKIMSYKRKSSMFDNLINNNSNVYKSNAKELEEIFIYNENSKPDIDDLKICIDFLSNEKSNSILPKKSEEYNKYISELEILNKTPQTVISNVKSKKKSYRNTILITDKTIDLNSSELELLPLKGDYYIARNDFESPKYSISFVKNEILSYEQIKHINGLDVDYLKLCYPVDLYEDNSKKGKIFVLNRSDWQFLASIKDAKKEIDFRTLLENLGYKIFLKESYTNLGKKYFKSFISTRTAEIELKENDYYLYEMLKENKMYLQKFDADYLKLKALINKIPPHSKVLSNYLNIYDIKRAFTPLNIIDSWKKATLSAKPIADELIKLRSDYALIYDFKELKTDEVSNFVGYCAYSAKILGLL